MNSFDGMPKSIGDLPIDMIEEGDKSHDPVVLDHVYIRPAVHTADTNISVYKKWKDSYMFIAVGLGPMHYMEPTHTDWVYYPVVVMSPIEMDPKFAGDATKELIDSLGLTHLPLDYPVKDNVKADNFALELSRESAKEVMKDIPAGVTDVISGYMRVRLTKESMALSVDMALQQAAHTMRAHAFLTRQMEEGKEAAESMKAGNSPKMH